MEKNEIKYRLYEEVWFKLDPEIVGQLLLFINPTPLGLVIIDQAGFVMSKKEAKGFCKNLLDNYSTRPAKDVLQINLNTADKFHD